MAYQVIFIEAGNLVTNDSQLWLVKVTAILPCASSSGRMRSMLKNLPKVAVRLASGKTLIEYNAEMLRRANVNEVIVELRREDDIVKRILSKEVHSSDFSYVIQRKSLGLDDAIYKALAYVHTDRAPGGHLCVCIEILFSQPISCSPQIVNAS